MSYPQALRHEVSYSGQVVRLEPQVHLVLMTLMMSRPNYTSVQSFIDIIWPNPDFEPKHAKNIVFNILLRLRRRFPGVIQNKYSFGYYIPL